MKNLLVKQPTRFYHRNDGIKLNTLRGKTWRDIIVISTIAGIIAGAGYFSQALAESYEQPNNYFVKKTVASASAELAEVVNEPTQEEIEKYIKTIFGKDARIAIAIQHNECNPANAKYPRCVLHSDVEYSVGIFQVNLHNSKQWVHAGRIPGRSMEEKVEWLKDPFNNTLYAYWVYQKSGWNPWSAYTNGNYLRSL